MPAAPPLPFLAGDGAALLAPPARVGAALLGRAGAGRAAFDLVAVRALRAEADVRAPAAPRAALALAGVRAWFVPGRAGLRPVPPDFLAAAPLRPRAAGAFAAGFAGALAAFALTVLAALAALAGAGRAGAAPFALAGVPAFLGGATGRPFAGAAALAGEAVRATTFAPDGFAADGLAGAALTGAAAFVGGAAALVAPSPRPAASFVRGGAADFSAFGGAAVGAGTEAGAAAPGVFTSPAALAADALDTSASLAAAAATR